MKAFLDIDIGDAARYATELAAYQRAADWLKAVGGQVRRLACPSSQLSPYHIAQLVTIIIRNSSVCDCFQQYGLSGRPEDLDEEQSR